MSNRALVWFRSDLRTRDHTPLALAAESGKPIIGVFVFCPDQWREHDWGGARVDFVLRNLRSLSERLWRLRIPLKILKVNRFADAPAALLRAARTWRCDSLFFNNEYELNESRRDEAVEHAARELGLEVRRADDQVILPPGSVRTAQGRAYTVFTPFKRAWLSRIADRGLLRRPETPKRQRDPGLKPDPIPAAVPGFSSSVGAELWPEGEEAALGRLSKFIAGPITRYALERNRPALDGTSALSPYLTLGIISPHRCLAAAANGRQVPSGSRRVGAQTWIFELIWRDFYKHLLPAFPRLSMGRAFKPWTDNLPWRQDEAQFSAWRKGRTGVPIVDAAMRQLNATGWMHNRLRMIAAMYLTKDLFIDWRWGERYFMQRLIDGDLAANNGGWQWSASTGTDAAPYFRMFNPYSQSRACDPDGRFIRRWVPELAGLDGDAIHAPHLLPAPARASLDYPQPIVDHDGARARILKVFRRFSPD